jgi:hypothetical protein
MSNPNPPNKINRDALHRYLYRRSDHFGRYKVNLRSLSEETGCAYNNLSTILTAMAAEGRLRRIAGRDYQAKTYRVEDPTAWSDANKV